MKSDRNLIHVVMSADSAFAHHMGVAMASMLKNIDAGYALAVYVLHFSFNEEDMGKIEALKGVRDFQLEFIKIDLKRIEKLKNFSSPYITPISSARALLPSLMKDLDKCLYLDSDVIVRKDISKLWQIDLGDNYWAAVEDPICHSRKDLLNIPAEYPYCNAGVILFNLGKMRKDNTENIIIDFIEKNHSRLGLGEQDTLNALFYDKCRILPLKWNVMTPVYICDTTFDQYGYKEIQQAWGDPAICHFTYEKKPDSLLCLHPYNREYLKYQKLTPWKNQKLADVTLKAFCLKLYSRAISFWFYIKRFLKIKAPFLFSFFKKMKSGLSFNSNNG